MQSFWGVGGVNKGAVVDLLTFSSVFVIFIVNAVVDICILCFQHRYKPTRTWMLHSIILIT